MVMPPEPQHMAKNVFLQPMPPGVKSAFDEARCPPLAEAIRGRHLSYKSIYAIRTLISDAQIGYAFKMMETEPRLIPIAVAALSDNDDKISGNAQWLVMHAASKGSKLTKALLRYGISNFLSSPWMQLQTASRSGRGCEMLQELQETLKGIGQFSDSAGLRNSGL